VLVVICQFLFCTQSLSRTLTEDIAKEFLGKLYVHHPLALKSPEGFDCTTFVEEVLAKRYINPVTALDLIRFKDGISGFFDRNHFMEEMWIPNALKHGIIAPVELPGVAKSSIMVDLAEWYRQNPEIVSKDAEYYQQANEQVQFTSSISYIPANRINKALLKKLPEETVVFTLRRYSKPPYKWLLNNNAIMITHMGLLFNGNRFYHASLKQKRVIVEDFSDYLQDNPTIHGAAFYAIP
jgi:hypothetical protein